MWEGGGSERDGDGDVDGVEWWWGGERGGVVSLVGGGKRGGGCFLLVGWGFTFCVTWMYDILFRAAEF